MKNDIISLFPTPVYATVLDPSFSTVISFFDRQEMSKESDHENYGLRSSNSYLMEEPECAKLKSEVLKHVVKYSLDILQYDYDEYKFGQSWVSLKHPGEQHTTHIHPNSLISGVIFYGHTDENTSAITFHHFVGAHGVPTLRPKLRQAERNQWSADTMHVQYSPGLMLLFPSHLHHSVARNTTKHVRKSLAFNLIPTIGFGEEGSLTEMKF